MAVVQGMMEKLARLAIAIHVCVCVCVFSGCGDSGCGSACCESQMRILPLSQGAVGYGHVSGLFVCCGDDFGSQWHTAQPMNPLVGVA